MAHFRPYDDQGLNNVYNMLFADDPALLTEGPRLGPPFDALYAQPANVATLRAAAADPANDARLRLMAYQRLRQVSAKIDKLVVLGVVVEVPQERGLDSFAAYRDARVRYINQTGSPLILEERAELVAPKAAALMQAADELARQAQPVRGERQAPPPSGEVRITLLASTGPIVLQAAFEKISRERRTAPVMSAAQELLEQVVELAGA